MIESGFTRKKVASLTLGEKLQKLRTEHRKSLPEVSRATKIQVKYLEALESGVYTVLPADVYVRGFLRGYARYLGCDEAALVRLYDRERHIQASLGQQKSESTRASSPLRFPSLVLTARTLWVTLMVLALSSVVLYLLLEYHTFVSAPRLVILEPKDQSTVSGSEVVVRGETDRDARVILNGQMVFVDAEGRFSEKLLLQPGLNVIGISSANRFEKERVETLNIDAVFPEEPAPLRESDGSTDSQAPVHLSVSAPEQAVQLSVTADGAEIWSGTLRGGEQKVFEAQKEIRLSSDNGKATYVQVGSDAPRALSPEARPLKDILFAPTPQEPYNEQTEG